MGASQGGLGAVAQPCCHACDDPTASKAASAVASAAGLRQAPRNLGAPQQVITCCPEEDLTTPDDKATLDYQLLSAAADGNLAAIADSLEGGASIEARRPLVFRTGVQKEQVDDEEDFQEVLVLEGQGVFQSRGFGYAEKSSPSQKDPPKDVENQGLTPLMRAAKEGRVQAVALLLEMKASPSSKDEEGKTPLHFAAAAGCRASCSTLLRAGADRFTMDNAKRDAFAHVPREFLSSTKERGQWISLLRHTSNA
eukprot:TRINITY_DN75284_c0_g1_i1.p1 TRINITY_DN75284_c0_g1~~TRINITY_DN75284_c0_g1_i1.p1  ORF type:complete len:253 (+),score=60.29 TRINITY_DN75284_c0_g1_i1:138-896(+)